MKWLFLLAGCLAVLSVATALLWRPLRSTLRHVEFERARREFRRRREWLEARFHETAASSGKPRGLRWVDCDFADEVTYARDRQAGELRAFVAVTVGFEAIEGGLMEGVEAVGNLRAATAVFRYTGAEWETDGRAIFNLNPSEAIAYYQQSLEHVREHPARR